MKLILLLLLTCPNIAYAYIDPGTGSLLVQILIATVVSCIFAVKMFWQKIKTFFNKLFSKNNINNEN